jgi:hypothetical protein
MTNGPKIIFDRSNIGSKDGSEQSFAWKTQPPLDLAMIVCSRFLFAVSASRRIFSNESLCCFLFFLDHDDHTHKSYDNYYCRRLYKQENVTDDDALRLVIDGIH